MEENSSKRNFFKKAGISVGVLSMLSVDDASAFSAEESGITIVKDYSELKSLPSSGLQDGHLIKVTDVGIAGDFVVGSNLDKSSGNDGTLIDFNDRSSTNKYAERIYSGAINIQWFGAVGDGEHIDTLHIQAAIDAQIDGCAIFVPPGRFVCNGLNVRNGSTITGVSSASNESGSVLLATEPGSIISWADRLSRLNIVGVNFESTSQNVTAIRQNVTIGVGQNYLDNSVIRDCFFYQSINVAIDANLLGCEIIRCNFHQRTTSEGVTAASRIAIKSLGTPSETSQEVAESNVNVVRECNFYYGLNPGGGHVELNRGTGWVFDSGTIFESISSQTTRAIVAKGIANLILRCYFEPTNDVDYIISLSADNSLAPQGSNAYFGDGCEFSMTGVQQAIVDVGAACTTSWSDAVRFTGNGVSNFATEKFGKKGEGWSSVGSILPTTLLKKTLFGDRGRLDIRDEVVSSYRKLLMANRSNPAIANQMVSSRLVKLLDSPSSPERLLKFTLPKTSYSEQGVAQASFIGVLQVTEVNSAFNFFNGMSIQFHVNMFKHARQEQAVAGVEVLSMLNEIGSPEIDVEIMERHIWLRFSHNPVGGNFSNGIYASVSGQLHHGSSSGSHIEHTTWEDV